MACEKSPTGLAKERRVDILAPVTKPGRYLANGTRNPNTIKTFSVPLVSVFILFYFALFCPKKHLFGVIFDL